jgi:hypothetical protein
MNNKPDKWSSAKIKLYRDICESVSALESQRLHEENLPGNKDDPLRIVIPMEEIVF